MQRTAPLRTYIPPSTTSYIPTYTYVRPPHTYLNTAHVVVSWQAVRINKKGGVDECISDTCNDERYLTHICCCP